MRRLGVGGVLTSLILTLLAAGPASACAVPHDDDHLVGRLVREINAERRRFDLDRLRASARLARGAQVHACDNAAHDRLSHVGTDGSAPGDRALRAGYDFALVTENVAIGYARPGEVLQAWLHSSGHRRNILDPRKTEIGVAVAVGRDGRMHWVMNGGHRRRKTRD